MSAGILKLAVGAFRLETPIAGSLVLLSTDNTDSELPSTEREKMMTSRKDLNVDN